MTRTNLVALLAVVPALALAQGDRPAPKAAGEAAPVELQPPPDDAVRAPTEGSATAADAGRGTVPPPDTYTVRPGDTLWDLSGRFLNNPWYWPKIWSYNPDITNPHWIFPGNVLKFYPAAEEAPARVEPVAAGAVAQAEAEAAEEEEAPVKELEDLTRADMKSPSPLEDNDAVAVAGPYKIGYVPSRTRYARHDTFVTPRELAESGSIRAAFEEKLMLATLDKAYADFGRKREVKVGETYLVYKTDRPIYHPVTHELFGYQSTVLGSAKVTAVTEKGATLVIAQSFEPIERGALLGPWTQKLYRAVERRPAKQAVEGRIVGSQLPVVTQIGEHHVVFLDRGERDGVEEGNVFKVVRSGDPYGTPTGRPTWDPKLPVETVGDLLVVDVKERASTALVTRSLRELQVGDRVEALPEAGSGGR